MTIELTADAINDIARGAAFLGTGGGGDPYIGRLLAQHAVATCGAPKVIDLADLPDDANLYTIAIMGAPTVMVEKLVGGDEVGLSVRALEQHTGRPATAILPVEMGGINSLLPVKLAAERGLPVVNADGMGRAFPELQMVTYNVMGIPATPLALANEHGEYNVISARDAKSAEDMARLMVIHMGGGVALSCYPMSGKEAKRAAIPGTLTLALGIGRAIAEGRRAGDPFEALLAYLRTTEYYRHCAVLFDGKIVDLVRETTRGFSIGRCLIAADGAASAEMEILFQNENLVARRSGRTVAIVPDLVTILDRETAEPITTEALKYGQRVRVVGASVPPIMRSPAALACFGPRSFGIEEDFQPIEKLI